MVRLELVSHTPNWGGLRWFLRCGEPECERRALRLYIDTTSTRVGCRQCLGLTHRSVQQHDARIDHARRDAEGFVESRRHLRSVRSGLVTAFLGMAAVEAMAAPSRGRGWGGGSMTSWKRARQEAFDQLVKDYEERWQRPFPGIGNR